MDFAAHADPEILPVLEVMPGLDLTAADIVEVRAAQDRFREAMADQVPEVPGVVSRDVTIDGPDGDLVLRIYEPESGHHGGALSYIHGGGMVLMSIEDTDYACRKIVEKVGCLVTSVEYRLAPEHPYPAPVDDCYAALVWLHDNADDLGVDRDRVAVGGQSAGGGLAAAVALRARTLDGPPLCLQWLVYPMIDDRNTTSSSHEITEPAVWNRAKNLWAWDAYLGDLAGTDDVPIEAAPARASVPALKGLPPAYLDVGTLDVFRDENLAFAQSLLEAGVPVEFHLTPGAFHASESYHPGAASSRRILGYRIDALRRALRPSDD